MTTDEAIASINRAIGVGPRKVTNTVINRKQVYPHMEQQMTSHSKAGREAGKGDAPRKQQDQKAYEEGWERIFKRDRPKERLIEEELIKEYEND